MAGIGAVVGFLLAENIQEKKRSSLSGKNFYDDDRELLAPLCSGVIVTGAKGYLAHVIDGLYIATEVVYDRVTVYRRADDPNVIIFYSRQNNNMFINDTSRNFERTGIRPFGETLAYAPTKRVLPTDLPLGMKWNVVSSNNRTYISAALSFTPAPPNWPERLRLLPGGPYQPSGAQSELMLQMLAPLANVSRLDCLDVLRYPLEDVEDAVPVPARIVDEWDPAPLIGCVRYVLVPTAAPRTALIGSTPAEDLGTIAIRRDSSASSVGPEGSSSRSTRSATSTRSSTSTRGSSRRSSRTDDVTDGNDAGTTPARRNSNKESGKEKKGRRRSTEPQPPPTPPPMPPPPPTADDDDDDDGDSNDAVPAGYTVHLDTYTGQPYFFCDVTGDSTWVVPVRPIVAAVAVPDP